MKEKEVALLAAFEKAASQSQGESNLDPKVLKENALMVDFLIACEKSKEQTSQEASAIAREKSDKKWANRKARWAAFKSKKN